MNIVLSSEMNLCAKLPMSSQVGCQQFIYYKTLPQTTSEVKKVFLIIMIITKQKEK